MGDRYELDCKCAYCGKMNFDIWYAPACNSLTFRCDKCKKTNFITSNLTTKKLEEVDYDDVFDAIAFASNFLTTEQIKKIAKETYEELKKCQK